MKIRTTPNIIAIFNPITKKYYDVEGYELDEPYFNNFVRNGKKLTSNDVSIVKLELQKPHTLSHWKNYFEQLLKLPVH